MINKILSRVISRPALFLVVYDELELTFSRPHPGAVAKAVAAQPVWWSPMARARALLKPADDKVTFITFARLFHTELRDDVGREYIFVSGRYFSFKTRLGRDNFDPKTDDLILKFGEPDGQYAQSMIEHCLPRVLAKVA